MNKILVLFLCSFLLVSCSQPAPTPDPALLAAQTEIAQLKIDMSKKDAEIVGVEAKLHALQSATPVTVIREVTQTFTPTPLYTPTITNTPAPTNTPTPTIDPLKKSRNSGFYLIGVDIAPGVWRSTGTGDDCYWAVTMADGDILDNHFGMSGGTAYVSPNGFQIEFDNCGTWEFVQEP